MSELEEEEILENTPNYNRISREESPLLAWFQDNFKGDQYIWFLTITLYLIGILVVYSATGTLAYQKFDGNTEYYLFKHSINVVLSFMAVWLCHRVDYRYFSKLSRLALLVSVPLLLITWKFGVNVNEANRWITIPFINQSFQPSDLAKLALITSIASILSKRQENVDDFQETVLPVLVWTGIICTLIGLSDVSSAILLFLTSVLLMFIGRVPVSQLVLLILVGFISTTLSLYLGQRMGTVQSRIDKYLNTEEVAFQAEQSYIAISTGGLIGKGPGNSDQRNFLPNPYSDFIYAIIIEEYGLLGGLAILSLYLSLLYRSMHVVAESKNPFGGILAAGLAFSLVIQAILNMAVAVGIVPITGLPLPLLSMGGTSLLFTGVALGIILSISRGEIDRDIDSLQTQGNA